MKSLSHIVCLAPFILLLWCTPPLASGETSHSDTLATLRWASTGGGWRAQFACIGFANLFGQLDILSKFSAISTTSGATWFLTQLFYSKEFYDRVVLAEDSQLLYDFVVDWMNAYSNMLDNAIQDGDTMELDHTVCNHLTESGDEKKKQLLSDLCSTLVYFDGDWAAFVEDMLVSAAKSYGDLDFGNKMAGSDNRLDVFKETDLLIQSALVPNSRIRDGKDNDTAVYIGSSPTAIYTVPISAAYVVNASGTAYRYSTESLQGDMTVKTSQTASEHSFSDWEDFYLYPAENGTVEIEGESHTKSTNSDIFSEAFGGGASSIIQVAAISSAAAGTKSPLVPSVFTQDFSIERYPIEQEGNIARLKAFDLKVARVYNQTLLDKFAVCSQWQSVASGQKSPPCGQNDGMFVDGWIADNPAFAINVGQYHISGGDLTKTMKVILTNTNDEWPTDQEPDFQYTQILQYFESPINKDVEPGSFNWPPGMWVPYQSPQIFSEFMDSSILNDLLEPIPGSNMTTAILKGTSIDNPIFGIRAGQQVEILLVILNEPITTYIVTPDLVQLYTDPLASMTKNIADNEELASRIKAFVEPLSDDDGDGAEPSSPNAGHSILQGGQFTAVAALSSVLFLVNFFMLA
mmetsp:Transcript_28865/g.53297  ORF Transcript_28865/g.53297 Transcript_28865/m.53297 type:complete len:632 (+) Transcript_28865:145-2040(+)